MSCNESSMSVWRAFQLSDSDSFPMQSSDCWLHSYFHTFKPLSLSYCCVCVCSVYYLVEMNSHTAAAMTSTSDTTTAAAASSTNPFQPPPLDLSPPPPLPLHAIHSAATLEADRRQSIQTSNRLKSRAFNSLQLSRHALNESSDVNSLKHTRLPLSLQNSPTVDVIQKSGRGGSIAKKKLLFQLPWRISCSTSAAAQLGWIVNINSKNPILYIDLLPHVSCTQHIQHIQYCCIMQNISDAILTICRCVLCSASFTHSVYRFVSFVCLM